MKSSLSTISLLLTLAFLPLPSHAVLGLFGKDDGIKEVPEDQVLAKQEADAQASFQQARALHNEGRFSKARDIYEEIVRQYPLTRTAANSQFEIGRSYEDEGKAHDAFDAYQGFVERFKQSDQFGEAIRRQFELATRSMNGKTGEVLLFIPAKAQPSKVIELFRQIAENAPFSSYAPLALYNSGLLELDAGHPDEAIVAFQEVVDRYSSDPKSKEAALQIIEIRESRATRDDSMIERTQLEMEKFIYDYGDDPRSEDLRAKVGELEEREAEKKFNIARYYERKGDLKAAAIYYQDVRSGTSRHEDAQARLDELRQTDPNIVAAPSAPKRRVTAETNTVGRADYIGPPPPNLEAPQAPKMRASEEDVIPIPVE